MRRLWKGIVPVLVHVVVLGDLRLTRRYLLLVLEKIAWAASAHLAGVSTAVMVGLRLPLLIKSCCFRYRVGHCGRFLQSLHLLRLSAATLLNCVQSIERVANGRSEHGSHGDLVPHQIIGRDRRYHRQVRETDRLLRELLVAIRVYSIHIRVFIYLDVIYPGVRTEI